MVYGILRSWEDGIRVYCWVERMVYRYITELRGWYTRVERMCAEWNVSCRRGLKAAQIRMKCCCLWWQGNSYLLLYYYISLSIGKHLSKEIIPWNAMLLLSSRLGMGNDMPWKFDFILCNVSPSSRVLWYDMLQISCCKPGLFSVGRFYPTWDFVIIVCCRDKSDKPSFCKQV